MRLIMAGGGTGGHLFPGLTVAREFQKRNDATEILFVGSQRGIEGRVLPREGFRLETLAIRGVKGRGFRGLMEALVGFPVSLLRSVGIVRRFRPECIIGLGGYASAPVVVAGVLRRIRCAILEQNLRPGLANRLLGKLVDRIFTTFEGSARFFPPGKISETGTPVRWEALPRVDRGEKFNLLVFGGSAGAHSINVGFLEALGRLKDLAQGLRVVHQTGEADFASTQKAYCALPFESEVHAFVEHMDQAYAGADLVICRAGASTIAEITLLGKAAILVPYPYATDDHQRTNAEVLRERRAAEMILDRELSGERLAGLIRGFFGNRHRIADMEREGLKLAHPGSAGKIVDECYAMLGR